MDCKSCGAPIATGALFCPKCGVSTLRGERVARPDEEPADDLKLRRRRVFFIGAAAVVAIVAIGRGPMFDFDFDDPDPRSGRPVAVEASEFFDAYRRDSDAADDRFEDRGLVVTGKFLRINQDDGGSPDLRLETSDPAMPLGVDVIRESHDEARALQPGQQVTVACEDIGRTGEERWLRDCSIEPVSLQGPPAPPEKPAAAEPPTAPAAS